MKKNYIIKATVLAALFASSSAQAAGFALIEQSASGMGNAFAGGAAVAEDASTVYFNPAGMTYIDGTQAVGALHLIKPSSEFNNNGSAAALGGKPLGGTGGDAGDLAFVPNMYVVTDIVPSVKLGLGINAPFGLKTEYDNGWMGRFQALKSEVKTININPAVAFKVNDQLSLGFGVSAMYAEATLTRAVNYGAAGEGSVRIKGDDWGFGFNLGAIYQATADTRIGVAYRSKVSQKLEGDANFTLPTGISAATAAVLAGRTPNSAVSAGVVLPETFSVSAFSKLDDKWDLMGDVTWTKWSRFKELRIDFASTLPDAVTAENWHNTMRYSIGANYHYSDALKLRAGLAYDEEAIDDAFRTARIPGNDRKWLSLGASYQLTPAGKVDVGYSHLFISSPSISDKQNLSATVANGNLIGSYDAEVNILSLQYTHNF